MKLSKVIHIIIIVLVIVFLLVCIAAEPRHSMPPRPQNVTPIKQDPYIGTPLPAPLQIRMVTPSLTHPPHNTPTQYTPTLTHAPTDTLVPTITNTPDTRKSPRCQ